MKKFLRVFAFFIMFALAMPWFAASSKANAQTLSNQAVQDAEEYMNRFLDSCPNRTSFSQGEKIAAEWIAQEFDALGLETKLQNFDGQYNGKKVSSQNVIGKLNLGYQKQVIICAHYDNLYGSDIIEGFGAEGAYNNASGVAVMLSLAKAFSELKEKNELDIQYNIVFLAAGADEMGLFGSGYYVKNMRSKEIDDTLLAINLDCVGGGDYLYLYCDELSTEHEEFIKKIADDRNLALRLPPANKKTITASTPVTPYLHYGLNSSNIYFLSAGINSAHFFSRNWDTNKKIGMVESETNPSIIYTKDDNRKTLKSLYGHSFVQKMNDAANIIFYVLTDPDFVKVMEKSAANKPNYSWLTNTSLAAYVKFGLIVILIGAVFMIVRNLNNRYPVPVITIRPSPPPTVFGEEYDNKGPGQNNINNNDNKNNNRPPNPFEGY
ncbi:MAG TPA: M28 family peptidase [Clostridia bacterium]